MCLVITPANNNKQNKQEQLRQWSPTPALDCRRGDVVTLDSPDDQLRIIDNWSLSESQTRPAQARPRPDGWSVLAGTDWPPLVSLDHRLSLCPELDLARTSQTGPLVRSVRNTEQCLMSSLLLVLVLLLVLNGNITDQQWSGLTYIAPVHSSSPPLNSSLFKSSLIVF